MHDPRLVKHVMESAENTIFPSRSGNRAAAAPTPAKSSKPTSPFRRHRRPAWTPRPHTKRHDQSRRLQNYVKLADAALRELTRDTITRNS